jgi:carbamoyl-phosphate synthase large subunit
MTLHVNSNHFAILISSASKKLPLIHAMQSAAHRTGFILKVISGDSSNSSLAKYLDENFWLMPKINDDALEQILNGCIERNIRIVLPTRDGELNFWATHEKYFATHGIHIIVSPLEAISKCIDKLAFSEFGQDIGLSVVKTAVEINEITATRFVTKERYGSGSREVGIDLDINGAQEHANKLTHPVFQPFIDGIELSADAWINQSHHVKALVLRRRDLVINGESSVTTTVTNTKVENEVKYCLEKFKLRGPVVLQGILDYSNQFHIIECNARFGGASTAGIAAGVDSLYWSIIEALGGNVNEIPFNRINGQLRQIRIAKDIHAYGPNL